MCNVYIGSKFYVGKAMSAMKHSAASKLNQQINEKDGEKKKTNYSGIDFKQANSASLAECGYLYINN